MAETSEATARHWGFHSIHMGFVPGLEPGSVIITDEAVDGLLRPYMEVVRPVPELFYSCWCSYH